MGNLISDDLEVKKYKANLRAGVSYYLLNNSTLNNTIDHGFVIDSLRRDFERILKSDGDFIKYNEYFDESNVELVSYHINTYSEFIYCREDSDKTFTDGLYEYTISKYSALLDFDLVVDDSKIIDIPELYKMSDNIISNTVKTRTGQFLSEFSESKNFSGDFNKSNMNNISSLIGYHANKNYDKFELVALNG